MRERAPPHAIPASMGRERLAAAGVRPQLAVLVMTMRSSVTVSIRRGGGGRATGVRRQGGE